MTRLAFMRFYEILWDSQVADSQVADSQVADSQVADSQSHVSMCPATVPAFFSHEFQKYILFMKDIKKLMENYGLSIEKVF